MDFRNKDPGAVQYGNFINYYQFNSAEDRLKLIEDAQSYWLQSTNDHSHGEPYLVLDVGCNSGVFTELLQSHLQDFMPHRKVIMYGVDIDEQLIQRARKRLLESKNPYISYDCVDVMNEQHFGTVIEYLKKHQRLQFDAVCCFSITMWIHLNNHDIGLMTFLQKLSSLAELFVVEPQPWKCYQTAERRLKKTGEVFELFSKLEWRSNVEEKIESYLELELKRNKVYESSPTKWKRKICFYR